MKESVVIYKNFIEAVRTLSPDQQAEAYNAYFDYAFDDVQYSGNNPIIAALMIMIKRQVDKDKSLYDAKKEAGRKGAMSRWNAMAENNSDNTDNHAINDDKKDGTPISANGKNSTPISANSKDGTPISANSSEKGANGKNGLNVNVNVNDNDNDNDNVNVNDIKKEKDKEKERAQEKNRLKARKETKPELNLKLFAAYNSDFSETMVAKISEWMAYKGKKNFVYEETGMKSLMTIMKKNIATYGEKAVSDVIDLSMSNGWTGIIWDKLAKGKSNSGSVNGATSFMEMLQQYEGDSS